MISIFKVPRASTIHDDRFQLESFKFSFCNKPGVVNLACSAAVSHSALDPYSGALGLPTGLQGLQVERKHPEVGGAHAPLVQAHSLHRILASEALQGPPREAHLVHFHRPQPPGKERGSIKLLYHHRSLERGRGRGCCKSMEEARNSKISKTFS